MLFLLLLTCIYHVHPPFSPPSRVVLVPPTPLHTTQFDIAGVAVLVENSTVLLCTQIEMPAVQSYWSFGPEGRAKIGIKENLIRFSTGIEGVEALWEDLKQALEHA